MTRVTRGVFGAVLLALLAALTLTACGGGGSSSSSTTTAAETTEQAENTQDASSSEGGLVAASKKVIAPYVGHPSPFPVTEKLKEVPKDGSFLYVNCGNAVCALLDELLEAAGATMGVPLEQVKAGYTASEAQSAFQTVVQKEPLATIVGAIPIELWTHELKELQEKEVAVVTAGTAGTEQYGIKAAMNGESSAHVLGELLANYMYAEMNPEAQVAFYYIPEVSTTTEIGKVFEAELAKICPKCSTRLVPIKDEELGSTGPSTIVSDLQSHPETTNVVYGNDEIGEGVPQAMATAGIEVETLGTAPTPTNLQYIKEGKETAALAIDFPVNVWMLEDMAAREVIGQELAPAEVKGVSDMQFLTQKDITFDPSKGWTGYPEFAERFAKLWGVKAP